MTPRHYVREDRRGRVVYIIACGAPPAGEIDEFVRIAQADGWNVCVIATPIGARFLDTEALATLTGHPVRVDWRMPGEADPLPPADAIVVAPATLTTVNKFRFGIADTLAVGILCEARGMGTPILVAPNVKAVLASHPAFEESLDVLRSWGINVLDQSDQPAGVRLPSWERIVAELNRLA